MTWDSSLHWRNMSTTEFVVDYSYYRFLSTTSPNRCTPNFFFYWYNAYFDFQNDIQTVCCIPVLCCYILGTDVAFCLNLIHLDDMEPHMLLIFILTSTKVFFKYESQSTATSNLYSTYTKWPLTQRQRMILFFIFNTIWAFWLVIQINQSWVLSPAHEKRGDAITLVKSRKPSVLQISSRSLWFPTKQRVVCPKWTFH